MLTKSDLENIGKVVDERIEKKLGEKIDEKLEKHLKPIRKDTTYLKKTVDILVKRTDEADVRLEKRVKRIEDHLGLASKN